CLPFAMPPQPMIPIFNLLLISNDRPFICLLLRVHQAAGFPAFTHKMIAQNENLCYHHSAESINFLPEEAHAGLSGGTERIGRAEWSDGLLFERQPRAQGGFAGAYP
ncbi:MAG: hypothetical protein RSC98_02225, partial [Clostridia bacterium]